jgi:tRNA-2-methylthio-N6-dimethylallyladenosine synthase
MNFAETTALERLLRDAGYYPAEHEGEADAVILNTCSVRATAEERIAGRIGYYTHRKKERPLRLVVMGCMAQRLKEQLIEQHPSVDFVIGTFEKERLPGLLRRTEAGTGGEERRVYAEESSFSFQQMHLRENDFRAFVPVMHGCNNFCSYCIVPYVRGREVSRDPAEILEETAAMTRRGVREITYLGQNVNSYRTTHAGRQLDFPGLLRMLLDSGQAPSWMRFITSHPKDVPDDLVTLLAEAPQLCSHLHLPVQHGSTEILRRMNRKYSRDDYLQLIGRIRERVPHISLSTDIMIGFPGETRQDFRDTLDLMREVRFDDAFTYYFNPREGTPAAEFSDQLSKSEKLARLNEVIELQREISRENRRRLIGQTVWVLAEEVSKKSSRELLGRTEGNQMVVFPGSRDQIGDFFRLRLSDLMGNTFRGEAVHETAGSRHS